MVIGSSSRQATELGSFTFYPLAALVLEGVGDVQRLIAGLNRPEDGAQSREGLSLLSTVRPCYPPSEAGKSLLKRISSLKLPSTAYLPVIIAAAPFISPRPMAIQTSAGVMMFSEGSGCWPS